ncbi:universal stress protein [Defluviimonas sp. WL0024]|uniref:Universal stress protein n=2 Tax=Albidovulum TaxID=205889 RepID=A0ABT3J6R7_9RHOB|nr:MULTISPECIES: universal stress protein [Defluviimonas]MCU9850207.1 universal stress protein [Defluviimonas sp. WL0024]MCW3783379.1 universal stress protein [Defluviimonas salinarum]
MIEKILVAVDGSGHSIKAVEYAATIAAACKAKLLVLTVLKPRQVPKVSDALRKYAELEHIEGTDYEAMKLLSSDLLAHAAEVARGKGATDIDKLVESGPVARTIVDLARRRKVDMIVLGSRGLGNIEATLRGGVSHRVELLSKCPVLTVK